MELRSFLSNKLSKPVTFGWGPRLLHSTGQFHKGGQPNGSFLQITANPSKDLAIPGEKFTFAELLMAQALGDASALAERNLPVIRIHLKKNNLDLQKLLQSI
jgi:glucose-6-phosphate isomerase